MLTENSVVVTLLGVLVVDFVELFLLFNVGLPELLEIVQFQVNLLLDPVLLQILMIFRQLYVDLPLFLEAYVVLNLLYLLLLGNVLRLDLLDALVGIFQRPLNQIVKILILL